MTSTRVLANDATLTFTFRRPSPAIEVNSLPTYPVFSFHVPTPALDIQHLPKQSFVFHHPRQVPRASKSDGMIFRNPFIRECEYLFSKPLLKIHGSDDTFLFEPPQPAIEVSTLAERSGARTFDFDKPIPVSPRKTK
jgi:hypothetical protein